MAAQQDGYREYVSSRLDQLRRTAYLLCGDWHTADDLVSTALVKLLRHWRRVAAMAYPDAWLRQVLLRAWLDEQRRPWRREQSWAVPPEPAAAQPGPEAGLDRVALLRYLAELPPRRRAVLVLRYFCDLSVEETADTLGISPGTVKSQTARALAAVRERLPVPLAGPGGGRRMRELTEAMRVATADPPPTSITIDKILVRERRRRTRLRWLAAAGAVVVAAGAAPVLAAVAGPEPEPALPPLIAPARTPDAPSLRELPELRQWTARVAAVAEDALPAGYRMAAAPTEYWAAEFSLMWADIAHPEGGRSQLLVFLDRDSDAAPPAGPEEVCAQPHPGVRFSGEEISCRPIVVDGVPLRVSTSRDALPQDPIPFEFTLVSQYRDGSAVHLWELPYQHPMRDGAVLPPVAGPVFTTEQLAELALDPALATV